MAGVLSRRLRVPLVGSFNDWFDYSIILAPSLRPALERKFRNFYRSCDLALCTSEGMREALGPHPNAIVHYPMGAERKEQIAKHRDRGDRPLRILYGGSVLLLPALFHSEEMARLFGLLVGNEPALLLMPWIKLIAWIWLPCVALGVILLAWSDWLGAMEIASVVLLSVAAPPLIAFTLFFCGMHSARHILRTIDYSGSLSRRLLALSALLPMIGVVVVSALVWWFLKGKSLDERLIQIVFVGLAALTVPHMALVERVRFSGWIKGAFQRP
jgi:Brp/Blh family beta-carotene 15,15'-monooxygenase